MAVKKVTTTYNGFCLVVELSQIGNITDLGALSSFGPVMAFGTLLCLVHLFLYLFNWC